MRRDGTVIQFRVDPLMQGAAHQHLPRPKRNRHGEGGKRGPEMGKDEAAATLHRTLSVGHHRTCANSGRSTTLTCAHMPSCPTLQYSWHGIR